MTDSQVTAVTLQKTLSVYTLTNVRLNRERKKRPSCHRFGFYTSENLPSEDLPGASEQARV